MSPIKLPTFAWGGRRNANRVRTAIPISMEGVADGLLQIFERLFHKIDRPRFHDLNGEVRAVVPVRRHNQDRSLSVAGVGADFGQDVLPDLNRRRTAKTNGKFEIEQDVAVGTAGQTLPRLGLGTGCVVVVAKRIEPVGKRLADCRVVFDNEGQRFHAVPFPLAGSQTVTVVPSSTRLSMRMSPPWVWIFRRAMGNPNPVPR